jgi:thiol-disulfide isomerase/thioredoxin
MAKPKRASRPSSTGRPGAGQQRATNTASTAKTAKTTTPTPKQPPRSQPAAGAGGGASATGQVARQSAAANGTSAGASAGTQRNGAAAATPVARQRAAVPPPTRQPDRRRFQRQSWWQKALQGQRATAAVLVTVVLLVGLFFLLAHNQQGSSGGTSTASPSVLQDVTNVSPTVISKVGTGGLAVPLKALPSGTPPLTTLTNSGKPEFLYVGAEYCPYCAAERWSIIVALSRFGTFSNLHLTTSADAPEDFPDTPTFTFYKSTYTSPYLSFVPVETLDRQENTLQTLTRAEQQIFDKYNTAPYTQNPGSIPFLNIGNQYVQIGSGYLPSVLANETSNSIATALSNPNSPVTQAIVGNANYLTAAICKMANNQPANVCTAAPIPQIEAQLPKGS